MNHTQSNFLQPSNIRYEALDALRGLALMGLFLVHMVEYYAMLHLNPEENLGHDIIYFFFSGKAYAAFAFLFGVSFFIIMDRSAKRGIDFKGRFVWRLVLLLFFGWLHGLVYFGDVLTSLAIIGLLTIPFYYLPKRVILSVAAFFLLQIPTLLYLGASILMNRELQGPPMGAENIPPAYEAFMNGTFWDVVKVNLWKTQFGVWLFNIEACRGSVILGMMLLGLAFGKSRVVENIEKYKPLLTKIALSLLAFGTLMYWLQLQVEANPLQDFGQFYLHNSVTCIKRAAFTIFGIAGFFLLYQLKTFQKGTSVLRPYGRMSLTLYIAQSLMCVPIFYGYGLNAYTYIGQTNAILLGFGLLILQIGFAHFWLKKFPYGPLERVWRKLTYLGS